MLYGHGGRKITKYNGETLYYKVMSAIKSKIRLGTLLYGERLPSEADLCEEYGVSRITIRRALEELEKNNFVKRIPNKGCVVSYNPVEHFVLGLYSFSEEARKRGQTPSSELLDFAELPVARIDARFMPDVKFKLFLNEMDRVYNFRYLRYINGEKVALDHSFIPVKFCPSITEADMRGAESAYTLMRRFDCEPERAQEYFWGYAVESEEEAEALGVDLGFAALRVMRVGYAKGMPVFLNYRIFRSSNYYYRVDLQKYEPLL